MSTSTSFRTVVANLPVFQRFPGSLKRMMVASMAAGFASMGHAAVFHLPPIFEITSCGTPSELTRGGFPCGLPSLGPGWGEIPGVGVFEQRAAIEFLIDKVSGPDQVLLTLKATSRSSYPELQNTPVIEFRGYRGDGLATEDDLILGDLLFSARIDAMGDYSFDVTSFVSAAARGGWGHIGFGLRDVSFGSDIAFTGANVMVLTVPGVPEPMAGALALAGLGVCALGLAMRQRKTGR